MSIKRKCKSIEYDNLTYLLKQDIELFIKDLEEEQDRTIKDIHDQIKDYKKNVAKDLRIISKLAPYFESEPPKGLCPMMYHTLSYEGDMEQFEKLNRLYYKYGV